LWRAWLKERKEDSSRCKEQQLNEEICGPASRWRDGQHWLRLKMYWAVVKQDRLYTAVSEVSLAGWTVQLQHCMEYRAVVKQDRPHTSVFEQNSAGLRGDPSCSGEPKCRQDHPSTAVREVPHTGWAFLLPHGTEYRAVVKQDRPHTAVPEQNSAGPRGDPSCRGEPRRAVGRRSPARRRFDSTLGYPGEGPPAHSVAKVQDKLAELRILTVN
jgi:hypothetical protein